jgi:cytidine deaminase
MDAELISQAQAIRAHAYCPHSDFQVGAALRSASGQVFTGVNVENDSYGATICAERSAICAMVSAGQRKISALAVATSTGGTPCGICLQVIREFAGADLPVSIVNTTTGKVVNLTLKDLLPKPFELEEA